MEMNRLIQAMAFASLSTLAGTAAAQIANTPHNLTAGATVNAFNKFSGTQQICVFCHTPHAANSGFSGAPLWNKSAGFAGTYQLYDTAWSSTIDGATAQPGSVSVACLSCHDGTQAMNNVVNAPGTGLGSGSISGTWTEGAGGSLDAGKIAAARVANLGTDLRNDHPIGIQYCGGGIGGSGTTLSGTCKDKDFKKNDTDGLKTADLGGTQVFWVDVTGGTAGTRDKTDVILFTRSGITGPSVECASCHDPHKQKGGSDDVHFMRVTTNQSAICLACHTK